MASEQFSLCWDNFHKNMSLGMSSLLENEDLVDVTLAVEGQYLKAHKMVLSVCSPYFRELFKVNPCKHPIVFMKDVSYIAMTDLLQFMYQGEVQVSQENLTTFIKTAEALQIKGLTGDENGLGDCESDSNEQITKTVEIETPKVNVVKEKKSATLPSAKRRKLSSSVIEATVSSEPKQEISQTELTADELIQFKMEPYEQSQTVTLPDDSSDTNALSEDQLDDGNAEDVNEDYSMIEKDDPKPGTSTDVATGESQDFKIQVGDDDGYTPKKRLNRMRFVVDGFVYHNNVMAGSPPLRYLGCAEYKRSGCRGRATLPVGGSLDLLKMTQPHNHPPDVNAVEKDAFLRELKVVVKSNSMRNATLKKVYETVAEIYPKAAEEISFRNISSSLHRWRKNSIM